MRMKQDMRTCHSRQLYMHRARWRGTVVIALSTVLLVSYVGTQPAHAALPRDRAADQPIPPVCAWRDVVSAAKGNVPFTDSTATSWVSFYYAHRGLLLHIKGQFPYARSMSFSVQPVTLSGGKTLTTSVTSGDSLDDVQIKPQAGNVNPFTPGANRRTTKRSYSIWVLFRTPSGSRQQNALSAGTSGLGALTYRVYAPDRGRDAQGGVPLPTIDKVIVLKEGANSKVIHVPMCPDPTLVHAAAVAGSFAATVRGWSPFVWHGMTMRSSPDSSALATRLTGGGGVVVVRFKAPTFPNTYKGAAITGHEQVRYWSMCEYELHSGHLVGCVADYQANLDKQGYATIILGETGGTAGKATAMRTANWLAFGRDQQEVLIYQQLLPAPGFTQAVRSASGSTTTMQAQMGTYYPAITRCSASNWMSGRCAVAAK